MNPPQEHVVEEKPNAQVPLHLYIGDIEVYGLLEERPTTTDYPDSEPDQDQGG